MEKHARTYVGLGGENAQLRRTSATLREAHVKHGSTCAIYGKENTYSQSDYNQKGFGQEQSYNPNQISASVEDKSLYQNKAENQQKMSLPNRIQRVRFDILNRIQGNLNRTWKNLIVFAMKMRKRK